MIMFTFTTPSSSCVQCIRPASELSCSNVHARLCVCDVHSSSMLQFCIYPAFQSLGSMIASISMYFITLFASSFTIHRRILFAIALVVVVVVVVPVPRNPYFLTFLCYLLHFPSYVIRCRTIQLFVCRKKLIFYLSRLQQFTLEFTRKLPNVCTRSHQNSSSSSSYSNGSNNNHTALIVKGYM